MVKLTSRRLLSIPIGLGLGLRLWGINFGLPYLYHPDEPTFVKISQTIFKTGDLNPHFFNHASFFFYLHTFAHLPFYLVGKVLGIFQSPGDIPGPELLFYTVGKTSMAATFLLGRMLTTFLNLLSVFLVFEIGKKLSGQVKVGLVAALIMAVSPIEISNSRTITPDVPLVFWSLICLWAASHILERRRWQFYGLTGFFAGLATATKYNGALVIILLPVACILRSGRRGLIDWRLYLGLLFALLGFLVAMPYAWLDFVNFREGFVFETWHYLAGGHLGMEGNAFIWYLNRLWQTEGLIFVMALAEITRGIWRNSHGVIFLMVFPVIYFAFISNLLVRNERTILPLLPYLYLLAALFLVELVSKLASYLSGRSLTCLTTALLIMLLGWPLRLAVIDSLRLTTIDSRETGRRWIAANLPRGSHLAMEFYTPYVDPQVFQVAGFKSLGQHQPEWYREKGFDYLIFAQGTYSRYLAEPEKYPGLAAVYQELFQGLKPVKIFTDGGYEVRIYEVN